MRDTILVVDDTPSNISVLMEILGGDYRVLAAINGEQALKIARGDPAPDLILLDVMMPEMNGHEVCRRLKADSVTRKIPVIFVTALSQVEDESTASLMTGFYRHLPQSGSKADALRLAKQEMIRSRRWSHPRLWAPFVLVGEPN